MTKFKFSLQKILDLRLFEKEQAELELGKVNAKIAKVNQALDKIAQDRARVSRQVSSTSDFDFSASSQKFFHLLDQRQEDCYQQLAVLNIEADEKRELVRLAMQKVKALEKMKDHKREEWEEDYKAEEKQILDHIATVKNSMTVMELQG